MESHEKVEFIGLHVSEQTFLSAQFFGLSLFVTGLSKIVNEVAKGSFERSAEERESSDRMIKKGLRDARLGLVMFIPVVSLFYKHRELLASIGRLVFFR